MKYLLEFGDVALCLGYAALKDFFNNQPLKPNPCCNDSNCRKRQKEFQAGSRASVLDRLKKDEIVEEEKEIENPFGIEMEDDDEDDDGVTTEPVTVKNATVEKTEASLDDLMNQLDNL